MCIELLVLPKNYFITTGLGVDKFKLVSFDKALHRAGLSDYNLLKVSSILPPGCKEQSCVNASLGCILFTAYSSICSSDKSTPISAAIGVGVPNSSLDVGVIMEYSLIGSEETAKKNVEDMIVSSMDLRGISIKQIHVKSIEVIPQGGSYSTAFAALAMW